MTASTFSDLGLTAKTDGCTCCSHSHQGDDGDTADRDAVIGAVSSEYMVEGMTCSHCVSSVADEIRMVQGVIDVSVDLNAGIASRVRVVSRHAIETRLVQEAVEAAGYRFASR